MKRIWYLIEELDFRLGSGQIVCVFYNNGEKKSRTPFHTSIRPWDERFNSIEITFSFSKLEDI